jgi:hypothetical protein
MAQSKQLDSILSRVTSATPKAAPEGQGAQSPAPAKALAVPESAEVVDLKPVRPKASKAAPKAPPAEPVAEAAKELQKSVQAYVPVSLVRALNIRAAEDGTTVRSLLLQGLKSIGFSVSDDEIRDRRK